MSSNDMSSTPNDSSPSNDATQAAALHNFREACDQAQKDMTAIATRLLASQDTLLQHLENNNTSTNAIAYEAPTTTTSPPATSSPNGPSTRTQTALTTLQTTLATTQATLTTTTAALERANTTIADQARTILDLKSRLDAADPPNVYKDEKVVRKRQRPFPTRPPVARKIIKELAGMRTETDQQWLAKQRREAREEAGKDVETSSSDGAEHEEGDDDDDNNNGQDEGGEESNDGPLIKTSSKPTPPSRSAGRFTGAGMRARRDQLR